MNLQSEISTFKACTPRNLDWGEDTFLGEDPFSHWFLKDTINEGKCKPIISVL